MHISLVLFFAGSAAADITRGRNLNGHLMTSCVTNICMPYQKLLKSGNPPRASKDVVCDIVWYDRSRSSKVVDFGPN